MAELDSTPPQGRFSSRYSLSGLLMTLLVIALGAAYLSTLGKLRRAQNELARLRLETGYLSPSTAAEIAAVRLPTETTMSYRLRLRVPESPPYRVTYSSLWPASATAPKWFGALKAPPGESVIVVSIAKDLRDDRWKISMVCRRDNGTRRMSTVIPADQLDIFLGSHDWLRSGISNRTEIRPAGDSLRLLDERVLVGEGAMMLYGDRPPNQDMIGIFAELQPDVGTL